MKKIYLIAAICLGITTIANAETNLNLSSEKLLPSTTKPSSINKTNEGEKKLAHVIKLNASQLALKNISLQYELGFHKNMSFALGYSNLLTRTVPDRFIDNEKADGFKKPFLKGFAVTPEFRFYPGKKEEKPAPHGFYLAPYLRYSKYTIGADLVQIDTLQVSPLALKTTNYNLSGSLKSTTVGLMMGSQWIIGKHFSFDWWILGLGFGKSTFALEGTTSGSLLPAQQEKLKTNITKNIEELPDFLTGGVIDIETTSNTAKIDINKIPMMSFRGMLTAGFNFGFKF